MRKSKAIAKILGNASARLPKDLTDLARLSIDDMLARGVSERVAIRIHASIELAKEIAEPQAKYRPRITGPATAIQYCLTELRALACHGVQEEFWVVTLDTKNQPIANHQITVGTLRNSLVHPREVFRPAIADAANCIIIAHNHPSGDPTPSDQDISVTERLESAAELLGIPVIDHIVVAGDRGLSIQEWRSNSHWHK